MVSPFHSRGTQIHSSYLRPQLFWGFLSLYYVTWDFHDLRITDRCNWKESVVKRQNIRELTAVWLNCLFSMERGRFCLRRTFLGITSRRLRTLQSLSIWTIGHRHWQCLAEKPQIWLLIPKYRAEKFPSRFGASVGQHGLFCKFCKWGKEFFKASWAPEAYMKSWRRKKSFQAKMNRIRKKTIDLPVDSAVGWKTTGIDESTGLVIILFLAG